MNSKQEPWMRIPEDETDAPKPPFFKWEFNFGHVLTFVGLVGSMATMWRAVEIRAVEQAKDLQFMDKRVGSVETVMRDITARVEGLSLNQEKIAILLDQHLKSLGMTQAK